MILLIGVRKASGHRIMVYHFVTPHDQEVSRLTWVFLDLVHYINIIVLHCVVL